MAERIRITDAITLNPSEIELSFIRSSGPGGQNVNKVATAVQLRFNLNRSPSLPEGLKVRATSLAGSKLANDGTIVLTASGYRSQQMNRQDAIARLVMLLQKAAVPPKHRRKTRPTLASKKRRLEAKTQRGTIKKLRRTKPALD